MKVIVNIGLVIAFSICYMQWGNNNSAFIAQVEYQLLFKEKNILQAVTHPLIAAGLIGQLLLLYSAIAVKAKKIIPVIAIALLSLVVLLILVAGILSVNYKMILSTIPFITLSVFFFYKFRKAKR